MYMLLPVVGSMEAILEFILLMGFLYWIYPALFVEGVLRVNKMVDVVTTRMMGTFNRFAPQDGQRKESLATISSLKRFSIEQRYKRSLTREAELKAKESHLYEIKETATPMIHPVKRPYTGLCCAGCTPSGRAKESHLYEIKETATPMIHPVKRPYTGLCCAGCTPSGRDSLVNKTTQNSPLLNVLEQNFSPQQNGLFYRLFPHLAQSHSLKKYDFPQVAGLILKEPRLKNAIEKTALEHFEDVDTNDDEIYKQLLKRNENRAKRILKDMQSTLSDFLLRFTSWVLYKLLPCFLSSVVVHHGQVEMLKEASESGHPLIFLPLHKSHLDYILISFILLNNNIRSPLVAAGDNLRIPFFGSLLRGLGAFFIKRRIDPIMGRKDHVYKTVLHTYMNACLRAGHNIEFFLEGGRTRTGKPCMPKYGILSVILDALMDGTIEDALLVPVSVNYEKLVDGNFVREQLGQPKEMETFGAAIKGIWHVLNSNYGMMRIDFHQPFSMRELVKTLDTTGKVHQVNGMVKKLKSNPSTTSLYGTDVVSDKYKPIVEKISKHIIYDCGNNTAVMSTNAVAFLLLNKFREGTKIDDLVVALDELRKELRNSNVDVGFSGDSLDVIHYAIELLGPAVIKREKVNNEEIIKPVSMLPNVIELAYYSNVVLPYYALESVVALALNNCYHPRLSYFFENDLVESSMDLCEILQFEFIFHKPCQSLDVCILDCIDDFVVKKEVLQRDNINSQDLERGRRIAQELFDQDDMLDGEEECNRGQNMPKLMINSEECVKGTLEFLRNLLLPIIEAYSITAFCLEKLVGRSMLEADLVKDVVKEMRRQVDCGVLNHEECVSSDSVKNAIKLFQKWEVLECHSENKLRLYYLKDMYDDIEAVTVIKQRIDKYRFVNDAE